MPEFFKGAIIQWVDVEAVETQVNCAPPLLERVLYAVDELVVVIELNENEGLPYVVARSDIVDALVGGAAVLRTVDPYAKYACPSKDLVEKHGHIRDRAWDIIGEVAEKEPDIYFSASRGGLIAGVLEKHKVTKKSVYAYLRRYWVRGCIINGLLPSYENCGAPGKDRIVKSDETGKGDQVKPKRGRPNKISQINPDHIGVNVTKNDILIFRTAIKLYYAKIKKRALRAVYDKMIPTFYYIGIRVERGIEVKVTPPSYQVPTFEQFRYWHQKTTELANLLRKRLGRNEYNLTAREILGDSTQQASGPGSLFQIDATIADVYLVSLLDPYRIIGRPVVYFVKDVFSTMTAGLYVGLESPSWTAAEMAIANATADKVAFCAEYEIEIEPDEWPCHHLCEKFVGDGGELLPINSDALIGKLNIGVANCPPYRGDLKAAVEREFGTVNEKVVEWLPGAVHAPEVEGRDYRLDATLNIYQFTRIIIIMILERNQNKWSKSYRLDRDMMADGVEPIPIKLWNWGISHRSGHLREKTQDVVRLALMPQDEATVTKQGILFNNMYYSCDRALREQWFVKARVQGRWNVPVSYDKRKVDVIYIINKDKTFEFCLLLEADARFKGSSFEEVQDYFEDQDIKAKQHQSTTMQSSARLHGTIEAELEEAKARKKAAGRPEASKSKQLKEIPMNREREKKLAREKEAVDLRGRPKQGTKPGTVISFSPENKDEPQVRTADQEKKDLLAMLKGMEKQEH